MTLPVSTSGGSVIVLPLLGEFGGAAVAGGVVGGLADPAGPQDADPGSGQDADGVGVVVPAGAGVGVDLRGPGRGVPAVVGEGGQCPAQALVAGPAEVDGLVLAGGGGDGADAG